MQDWRFGIDVGSTTVKLIVRDRETGEILYSTYRRHFARQRETLEEILAEIQPKFSERKMKGAVCGSGGKPIAEKLGLPFVQEVVANAAAVCERYPNAGTAIELGGQDAKIIFFQKDEKTGELRTSDMRMNGSCAGGTGAFLDEIATLLHVDTADFEKLAAKGTTVYEISGRCGVFAKTDIQPLLIQGAPREDIALSTLHAIAKQTIGGLSQGLRLTPPILFEGGPLTFNPTLIRVFAKRLNLKEEEILIPEHPETIVALGASIAVDSLFSDAEEVTVEELLKRCGRSLEGTEEETAFEPPFFQNPEEKEAFLKRHYGELKQPERAVLENGVLEAYLGIDSGSTTSKFVLLDRGERVVDTFYAANHGEPLKVICGGLTELYEKYRKQGTELKILGVGTTGYGEKMAAKAFQADFHIVETVAHAQGCMKFVPDASFLLDIGGQDMKAIWINDGVITDILLNEACSSGCGCFLENFASSLGMEAEEIAENAFSSQSPARLGSRCTVFMNSTIINEQREGKLPKDIMAGLCRSIIENVFTKVVRVNRKETLGNRIVVQGGTFRNLAVLRAMEEYVGKDVTLAPYPGEMGALGVALLTKRQIETYGYADGKGSSFIGFDKVKSFSYEIRTGVPCNGCANHCRRTIMQFAGIGSYVTGNRCERGLIGNGEPKKKKEQAAPDLFADRNHWLFETYSFTPVREPQKERIGIPRVLEFWDSMPFWTTFFRALGYEVVLSHKSSRTQYEKGLSYVASDTICFPAKLVHGHILDLAEQKADRIFMPYVMHMPPEGKDKLSPYVCSVVQGYPMVIQNGQNPVKNYGIPFDTPIFHWFQEKDRKAQICRYAQECLHAGRKEAGEAFRQAESALLQFRNRLYAGAEEVIAYAREHHTFAVVLAGRPYHSDPLVNHEVSKVFTRRGIPVLPADALAEIREEDLSRTRVEITNNFHTRMLASAMAAAEREELEYVQLVSFGCGHDAVLSDEIVRILESGKKSPLVLKIDESDAAGALDIRISSFIESVRIRREKQKGPYTVRPLPEPNPAKFYKSDKKKRTLLVPNISAEVSVLLEGILEKEQFQVKRVPVGGLEQIRLGKQYVHNDICFPAQMVIGELIGELQRGHYKQSEVAVCMVKFQCDCRMSHYAGLLRKGLDSAGFSEVPVLTTDVNDTKEMHPGVFLLGISAVLEAVWAFMMLDILTELCRKIRPYECRSGETNQVYQACVRRISDAMKTGIGEARKEFEGCIDAMAKIPYDRSHKKPAVFVTGELLVTYHPGSNFKIEEYLESNGMETIFPRITDQLRKDFLASGVEIKDYHANIPPYPFLVSWLFDTIQEKLEKSAKRHPLYEKGMKPKALYEGVKEIIPSTLSCGEGWLMAAEIDHYARAGVKSFVILQPFGCLPNHICGRGVIKSLKEKYPDIQILPLDLDPDTSYANVENRLQMLLMNREETI
ncbi:MAG: acyl-CoA dehydratase activase [Eubacteriales bacterium]|nr:acyl-CoA dehydratase activase [Eubacteriales bacterium]